MFGWSSLLMWSCVDFGLPKVRNIFVTYNYVITTDVLPFLQMFYKYLRDNLDGQRLIFFYFFLFFEVIFSLFGLYWANFGVEMESEKILLLLTNNFIFVSFFVFWLLDFLLFGVILRLLGPYRAFFGLGWGPRSFLGPTH